MAVFFWAFEDDLFGERPGAGIADYARRIEALTTGGRRPGRVRR
jgi:hypothetical protein